MGFNTSLKTTFNGSIDFEKYDVFYKQMFEMEAVEDSNVRCRSRSFSMTFFILVTIITIFLVQNYKVGRHIVKFYLIFKSPKAI